MTITEITRWALSQPDPPLTDAEIVAAYVHLGKHAASACWTNENHLIIRQLLIGIIRERNH